MQPCGLQRSERELILRQLATWSATRCEETVSPEQRPRRKAERSKQAMPINADVSRDFSDLSLIVIRYRTVRARYVLLVLYCTVQKYCTVNVGTYVTSYVLRSKCGFLWLVAIQILTVNTQDDNARKTLGTSSHSQMILGNSIPFSTSEPQIIISVRLN